MHCTAFLLSSDYYRRWNSCMPFPRLRKCHAIIWATKILEWSIHWLKASIHATPPFVVDEETLSFSTSSPEAPSSRRRGPFVKLKRRWRNAEFLHSSNEAPSSRRRGTAMTPDAPMEQFAHTQSVSRCKDPLCTKLRCPLHETRMPFARNSDALCAKLPPYRCYPSFFLYLANF